MCRSAQSDVIPVLVIFAPTASGKTAAVGRLFSKDAPSFFAGKAEIINADSMQVYKKLDIGTAKPDAAFLKNLPHHLLDIVSPTEQFGTGEFVRLADIAARDIWSRGKLPVICGGTAFYIRNFIYGLPVTPESDSVVRRRLQERLKSEGKEILFSELKKHDPVSASRIHVNDEYRIVRALEVFYSSGSPLSSFDLSQKMRSPYKFLVLSLERSREELYIRINLRVEEMFKNGLVNEVKSLITSGLKSSDPGMEAIGYREFFMTDSYPFSANFSEGNIDIIKSLIQRNSRHYAKRQITFFKPLSNIVSVNADDYKTMESKISQFFNPFT